MIAKRIWLTIFCEEVTYGKRQKEGTTFFENYIFLMKQQHKIIWILLIRREMEVEKTY